MTDDLIAGLLTAWAAMAVVLGVALVAAHFDYKRRSRHEGR